MSDCQHTNCGTVLVGGRSGKPENRWRCLECYELLGPATTPPIAYRKYGVWYSMDLATSPDLIAQDDVIADNLDDR